MSVWFTIPLLLAQSPTSDVSQAPVPHTTEPRDAASGAATEVTPPVERYEGPFAEGAAELQRLALAGDTDGALALSDSLLVPGPLAGLRARAERRTGGASERLLASVAEPLTWLGMPVNESANRAEVHYARGLVFAQRSDLQPSDESFELARVLAGPGTTRLDAIYNQGNLDFALGEAVRQMIPEIVGEDAVVERPEDMEEEPLDVARAAYAAARAHYVERLSADWQDADTRANVELTLRRLKELDEVEREREEQQDESEQEDQEKKEGEQEPSDEKQESEDEPSDEDGSEDQDADQPDESEEEQSEEEKSEEEQEDEGDQSDEQAEQESEAQQAEPKEQTEEHLTDEEVKRLLERLQELDEKGEELRERLRGVRRVPVKRDW